LLGFFIGNRLAVMTEKGGRSRPLAVESRWTTDLIDVVVRRLLGPYAVGVYEILACPLAREPIPDSRLMARKSSRLVGLSGFRV
jgi:hypothetical protein